MSRAWLVLLLAVALLAVSPTIVSGQTACPADAIDGDHAVSSPQIVSVYPDPTTSGNVGEHVTIAVPPGTNLSGMTLTDGHSRAALPATSHGGPLALTMDPDATESMTDDPVAALDGYLRLAADGDSLELRRNGETLDVVAYGQATTAHRWYRTGPGERDGAWWPREATCEPPLSVDGTEATAFVLPDAPDVPLETIEGATDRLLVAGYEFTSMTVAEAVAAAADRGVNVSVLLEGRPVSGTPHGSDAAIGEMTEAGASVRLIGEYAGRYRYHHPKYLVADDTVLVTTENWKPAGVGGASSRGWGVRVSQPRLADALAEVFRTDFAGWDTGAGPTSGGPPPGPPPAPYEPNHPPEHVAVEDIELLLAPDNAEDRLLELVSEAEESIRIKQVSIGGRSFPLLEAAVAAARRGVRVRILLDSSWYSEEDNSELADWLAETADREDLDLEARLVEPGDRFEKIHAKGLVIDGETTVVGSANWNPNSFRNNREVLLALHGPEPAAYFTMVFDADWGDTGWSIPVGLAAAVVAALAGAALLGVRQIVFKTDA